MRIGGFSILSTVLHSFGSRKALSSSRSATLPNIFARRNPRTAARLAARHLAGKSIGRIRNSRTGSTTWRSPADPPRAANTHGGAQRPRVPRPLRRSNTVLLPPPPTVTHPQPPGAYTPDTSFTMPEHFPELNGTHNPHLFPLVQQQLFLEALYAARQTLLRAESERRKAAVARRRAEDAEFARLLEQDWERANAAQCRAEEDAEYARLIEEDARKAREAQRKAEEEEEKERVKERARLHEEERRRARAQEAQRRAEEREAAERREREQLEEKRRRAEQKAAAERERQEREKLFKKAMDEAKQSWLVERFRVYEETWAALRANAAGVEHLGFRDIPWPVFANVRSADDVTEERVLEFVGHPLYKSTRDPSGSQAKTLRSEMLRWHPDKFEGKVLNRVVEADREAVNKAAGHVVRILNRLGAGMR